MWTSHESMLWLWVACVITGAGSLLCLWNGSGSPSFIIGQIIMGLIGIMRERHLAKHGFKLN